MKNEPCNYFQKTHSLASPCDELQDPGNSVGLKGIQPVFRRVRVWFNSVLKFLIIFEQGAPHFHFVLRNLFLTLITVAQALLSKLSEGRATWGTFLGLWCGRVWVLMAAPGWLRMTALGSWVGPQLNETVGKAHLDVHPQRREASFYSSIDKIRGTKQKLPQPKTYQQSSQRSVTPWSNPSWSRRNGWDPKKLIQSLLAILWWCSIFNQAQILKS